LKLRVICSLPQRIFSRRVRDDLRRLFCKGANSDAVPVYKKNNISKQQGQPGFALKL